MFYNLSKLNTLLPFGMILCIYIYIYIFQPCHILLSFFACSEDLHFGSAMMKVAGMDSGRNIACWQIQHQHAN